MATRRVFPEELGEHVRDRLNTVLASGLPQDSLGNRLKTCAFGTLEQFASRLLHPGTLPAILVRTETMQVAFHGVGHKMYEATYTYRILYIRKYAPAEEVESIKAECARRITEALVDELKLDNFSFPSGNEAGQVIWTLPSFIDMEPPERSLFVGLAGENMVAIAVTFQVFVTSRR